MEVVVILFNLEYTPCILKQIVLKIRRKKKRGGERRLL